jgi:hypothetical protein
MAMTLLSVSAGAAAWILIGASGVADAATHLRSGARAHFESTTRIASDGTAPGFHLTGPDVMAAVVGLMAVLAFLFLVVTFIRRRVHAPLLTPSPTA